MSFKAGGDLCLGFFQTFWDEGLLPPIPEGGKVLEIGCAEADWLTPMKAARPDLHLTGIDQRGPHRHAADVCLKADVLTHEFPTHEFDAIVAVSMLEWAGIGHYGDPIDPDGDVKTLQRAKRWLKLSGWLYFDVPYSSTPKPQNPHMRVYDDDSFRQLFWKTGWTPIQRRWFSGDGHPDGPYVAHVLKPKEM